MALYTTFVKLVVEPINDLFHPEAIKLFVRVSQTDVGGTSIKTTTKHQRPYPKFVSSL